jgi:3-phenylpropionate/cinnamic acid dioxygenase small subunit
VTSLALWHEVQQFLFREARLLDERRFKEWVDLFTDDVLYWAPILTNRVGRDARLEVQKFGESAHFEDGKASLANRVKRFDTGMAWAEVPPSRTRHLISNVEVESIEGSEELRVRSAFLVWRPTRRSTPARAPTCCAGKRGASPLRGARFTSTREPSWARTWRSSSRRRRAGPHGLHVAQPADAGAVVEAARA